MKAKPNIDVQKIINSPSGQLNKHLLAAQKPKKASKYGNVKIDTEDGSFDSKKEEKQWRILKQREKAGEIYGLSRQTRFMLPGDIVYLADFTYFELTPPIRVINPPWENKFVVCDAKGVHTDVYKIKKKLMQARYGIEIEEV